MTRDEFVKLVQEECKLHGVRFHRAPDVSIGNPGGECKGWFGTEDDDYTEYALSFAGGGSPLVWFPVLVHEFCHMQQWLDNDPTWVKSEKATETFWDWIEGTEELSLGEIRKQGLLLLDVELDCDRRAHSMIKELSLPIDPDWYAKQANAYVFFYHMVMKHRRWYKIGQEPYNVKKIINIMPIHLRGDHHTISNKMMKVYGEALGWQ